MIFLLDWPQLIQHVLEGEGVGWLKLNRLKKLMEDESYRNMVLSKLNRNYNRRTSPNDKVDDAVSFTITTVSLLAYYDTIFTQQSL